MKIEAKIRDYIANNLIYSPTGFNYADDTSFLREGIVDSIGVMELVSFVQAEFEITIGPDEVTPDNFDSVAKLAAFIREKRGEIASGSSTAPAL